MTGAGATQKGGSSNVDVIDQDQGVVEHVPTDRELAMQKVVAETQGEPVVSEESDLPPSVDPDPAAPSLPAEVQPEVLKGDDLDGLVVETVVDGEVQQVSVAELAKGHQKSAAASRRMQEAAEKRKQLDQRQKELDEREAALSKSVEQEDPPSEDEPNEDGLIDEQVNAAVEAIIEGDAEKAAAGLKDALVKGRGAAATPAPVIDEEAIVAKATTEVKAEIKEDELRRERTEAFDNFLSQNEAFADESSKERKYGDYLFATEFSQKIEAGEISYQEALVSCAERVNEIYPSTPASDPDPPPQPSARERKKSLDKVPVAGGRAVKPAQPEKTMDDALASMRKARGQMG